MTIQQSIQIPDRHCAKQNESNTQQVNCKGDKIENIAQLLMHLGMDDIKHKCDDCDIEVRSACSAKQAQIEPVTRAKLVTETAVTDRQCIETDLLSRRALSEKKRAVESKLLLSSIFASLFVVVMTFQ
ncbi:MAG: hypothetical protein QNK26_04635 [Moritella sp.]|uniref:hypothetical protein n=1 Tax=Moritella sp. TaxID=78556 RepID=UPI0029BA1FAA|nr:hypothetical protein [Moritella sp.]MDX2319866.1 hypothetical protein [Moritella sp.]